MGTPQISICAGEEVLRIALRVLQATHKPIIGKFVLALKIVHIWSILKKIARRGDFFCVYEKKVVNLRRKLYATMKIVLSIVAIAAAMVLLSVGVILRNDKQFRSQHISENKRMRERGVHCAVTQDRQARRQGNKINTKEL